MLRRKNRPVAAMMSVVLGMMLVAKPNPAAAADSYCGWTYDFEMTDPIPGYAHGVVSPGPFYYVTSLYGNVNTHPETIMSQWTSEHTAGLFGHLQYHFSCGS